MVKMIFDINPEKFRNSAKNKTYAEWRDYLMSQPNFQIFSRLTEAQKRELYELSTKE